MSKKHVYVLIHESEIHDIKVCGVFWKKKTARKARRFLRGQPGFASECDGFGIGRYKIGQVCWRSGFVTIPLPGGLLVEDAHP